MKSIKNWLGKSISNPSAYLCQAMRERTGSETKTPRRSLFIFLVNQRDTTYIRERRNADRIRGGGFVKPATSQLELLWEIHRSFAPYGLSICVLSYSLAPEAQYPIQLEQSLDLVQYLIFSKGRKPSDVRARPIRVLEL